MKKSFLIIALFLISIELTHCARKSTTDSDKKATLPTSEHNAETCEKPDKKSGIARLVITADSPSGPIHTFIIQFDTKRGLPITSTAMHDTLDQINVVPRLDNFRVLPCPEVVPFEMKCQRPFKATAEQTAKSGHTSWDRGHLVPANPNHFSPEAMDDTFYCANMAPQDPYTNEKPWNQIEALALNYFKTFPGFVVTGVCDKDDEVDGGKTKDGYNIPACYWKLICYKDNGNGDTVVVGFIGENTMVNDRADKDAADERWTSTTTPRSQADIAKLTRPKYIQLAWKDAAKFLLGGRDEPNTPNPDECFAKMDLSPATKKEWTKARPHH